MVIGTDLRFEVGYAKTPKALIDFAHSVAGQTGVILDPLIYRTDVMAFDKKDGKKIHGILEIVC